MKIIDRLDEKLLKFFENVARKFNWLTGKDNFFLARICCVLHAICYLIFFVSLSSFLPPKFKGVGYLFVAVGAGMCSVILFTGFRLINSGEEIRKIEQEIGAKNPFTHLMDEISRKESVVLFLFVVFSLPFLFVLLFEISLKAGFYILLATWFHVCVRYFISIDKPPFNRSKVWEKIKDFFKPIPVLKPIPIKAVNRSTF